MVPRSIVTLGVAIPSNVSNRSSGNDPRRQRIADLFRAWWEHHGSTPIKADQIAEPVKAIADPQRRGRQYLATFLSGLAGTHAAGFVLTRQDPAGKWTAATYALTKAAPPGQHAIGPIGRIGLPGWSPQFLSLLWVLCKRPLMAWCRPARRRKYECRSRSA